MAGVGICRVGDVCSGHGCWGPRPSSESSANVIVNGRGVMVVGHRFVTHCCGGHCHDGVAAGGSSKLVSNGRAAFRNGDPISCGSRGANGALNVIVGG